MYGHYDVLSEALIHRILAMNPRPDLHEDVRHRPVLRLWFYMPLMHSESMDSHRLMLRMFDNLKADCHDEDGIKYVNLFHGFEVRHSEIIETFGRYPHRNEALGRKSTDEEEKYLRDGGEKFGVGG